MIVPAKPLEDQLVEWLRDFQPDSDLRHRIIDAIKAAAREQAGDQPERRRDLLTQLNRLQDLYVMGDLTKSQYMMRRQALDDEVQRIGPPIDPDIAKVQKLLAQLFERVWQDGGTIVAVKPRAPFARYFQAANTAGCDERERRGSNPHLTPRIEIRL